MSEGLRRAIPVAVGLALFLAALEVLRVELRTVSWHELTADVIRTPPSQLGLAFVLTALNYATLTGYDLPAFAYIGKTVLGLFRLVGKLGDAASIGDELLALDAIAFLTSCVLAYSALRQRDRDRRRRIERFADACFLTALRLLVIVSALMAYELL